jgi:hypothetical protein
VSSGKELLSDDVRRWSENLAEGSYWARKSFLHRLSAYCEYRKLSPQGIVNDFQTDKKKGQDTLEGYLRWPKASGKSAATIKAALTAVRSWLSHLASGD